MAYMIYQQYKTAIKEAYANHADAAAHAQSARAYREWLQSLAIDPKLRDQLVEQARNGNILAAREVLDRTLGKVTTTIAMEQSHPVIKIYGVDADGKCVMDYV